MLSLLSSINSAIILLDFIQLNIIVQCVPLEQHQILARETSTILFAFCGMPLKTNQCEIIVEECAQLPARRDVLLIKPQHDSAAAAGHVDASQSIDNLFAGLVQECHLQL